MNRITRRTVLVCSLLLAACSGGPSPVAQPTLPVVSPTPSVASPAPTAPPAAAPTAPPAECGPEAAIALAQTHSDLSLAADGKVEALLQAQADSLTIAQTGLDEFSLARDLMRAYAVPDCLLQAKVFADQFFAERIDAYTALLGNDQAGYDLHLGNSEIARQNMIAVVNGVLGQ